MKIILVTLLCIFSFSKAHASDWLLSPSLFYEDYSTDSSGSKTKDKKLMINTKFGVMLDTNLFVGGVYDMVNRGDITEDDDERAYGAAVGYIGANWQFYATYFVRAEIESGSGGAKLTGTGYSADVSYIFDMGGWGLGPCLTYRHFHYDKSGSTSTDITRNHTLPVVQLVFKF